MNYFKEFLIVIIGLLHNNQIYEKGISGIKISFDEIDNFRRNNISSFSKANDEHKMEYSRLGSDSHADISCAGRDAVIVEYLEGRSCTVHPFNDTYTPRSNVKLCNAVFAYDSEDGKVLLLKINQCLDFTREMQHSLFSTNQVRSNGIIVDDVPAIIDVRNKSRQAIILPEEGITLPLLMNGPVAYIPIRKPTDSEMENCRVIELTSSDIWNPDESIGNDYERTISSIQSEILFRTLNDKVMVRAVTHTSHGTLNPSFLSKFWDIPLVDAKRTLTSTEYQSVSIPEGNLTRRRRLGYNRRDYRKLSGYAGQFASDTFFSNVESLRGNKCIQLFCNKARFICSYPLKSKGEANNALIRFIHEVGVPSEILTDGARELIRSEWSKTCKRFNIRQPTTEPYSPWQNPAEMNGGVVKRRVRRLMKKTNTPVRLWDYCWEYATSLKVLTASKHFMLDERTPFEKVYGHTPNITEYIQYQWYEWIWYYDIMEINKESLGRWIGPSLHIGEMHTSYILAESGTVITRSTTRPVTTEEYESQEVKDRMSKFTSNVESVIGNYHKSTMSSHEAYTDDPYEHLFEGDNLDEDEISLQDVDENGNPVDPPNHDELIKHDAPVEESMDEHIGMKLDLNHEGEIRTGKIIGRKRNYDGTLVGTSNRNPFLDTRTYLVDFGDGSYHEYSTNVIMESLYEQVDDDGNNSMLLTGICDHRFDSSAISKEHGWVILPNGIRKRRVTTKGWELLVKWSDDSESWLPLSLLKESNPIETAEYAFSRGLEEEPAFAWWVGRTLKRRDKIVSKLKSRKFKSNLKFGLKVPRSVEEAYQIDRENKNNYWDLAIKKELKNVIVAFQLLEDDEPIPIGSRKIPYHFIFDIKFDLTRKARLVAGGHQNKEVPAYATYSSVASRESIRMAFLIAAMNSMEVLAADIGNAYLNAPCHEKVHVTVGPELFGEENSGKTAIIVRALYGLKSAGASWRKHLSTHIQTYLKFTPSRADHDIYFKGKVKDDGAKYYAYLVVYVDDILSVDFQPKAAIDQLGAYFRIKEGSVSFPNMYLGANVRKWKVQDESGTDVPTIAMGSHGYIKEAVRIIEERMVEHQLNYPSKKAKTPFTSATYRPELDETEFCNPELITLYQNITGILRWICELGRMDILLESSLLAQYMVNPRIGHLTQSLNLMHYLKLHDRSWIVFDPSKFDIEWEPFGEEMHPRERAKLLAKIYPDSNSGDPPGMPEPRGASIQITAFVDADHAGNRVTRRSHTGIIVFGNMAPLRWYSKRQNNVESSTFGSEFVALKTAVEIIEGMRYKLQMLGVPLDGETRILCDNQSVVKNSTFPESVLRKKHCSIAYHLVRENVASGRTLIYWENTKSNLADLFTKVMTRDRRSELIRGMMF